MEEIVFTKDSRWIGIKDLEQFNLSLLGKQVWRVIHNTNSLFYKVFKAKYFPNCSILDEEVKTHGSYVWQSILKARSMFVKELLGELVMEKGSSSREIIGFQIHIAGK